MGTRNAVREAKIKRENYFNNYMVRLCSLFHNSVTVENETEDKCPKRYLLRVLLNKGGIAYDRETGLYLPYVKRGVDVYGLPTSYTLVGYNGYNVTRSPEQVVILRANDLKAPLIMYFEQQINKLVDLDLAIEQNLDAIKTMSVAEVQDEASLLSLTNEYNARRLGATVVYKNKQAMSGAELKVSSTGAQYLGDKLLEARKEVLNETLSTIGISVANTDKRERVQSMEVLASQGYALDSINMLINTFNHDAEVGGITIRLKGNTSLIEQNELENKIKLKEGENKNETND